MTAHTIRTVSDMVALPPAQFSSMLADLAIWYVAARHQHLQGAALPDTFHWTDQPTGTAPAGQAAAAGTSQ